MVHRYKLINSPSIESIHNMSSVLRLTERREKQLLHLMLRYSKSGKNVLKGNI